MSEPKLCIFKLFTSCHVVERSNTGIEFGSLEWIQTICSMCIKAIYARRFKAKRFMKYTVVNTL